MSDNVEKKEECCKDESESCCRSSCGCGSSCAAAKVLLVALLLAIGGILGYLMAGNCYSKKMCHSMMKGQGGLAGCPMAPMSEHEEGKK